jgi:HAD superfamily hydrolase (TIGR01509 family)
MRLSCDIPGAVIFDMDGLMLDTERPMVELWLKASANLGYSMDSETICRTIGIDIRVSEQIYKSAYGKSFPYATVRAELFRLWNEAVEREGIAVKPGLSILLDRLEELKIPWAVATSTETDKVRWKLSKAGLEGRFPILACGEEVQRGKPAPDIFLLAAGRLGKKPAECIGFEDSPAGLEGLKAAGIRSVFIKDMLEPPPEILAGVWRRYNDLGEAAAIFDIN